MKKFLSFVCLASVSVLAWALLYTLYLILILNVPRDFVFSTKTEDPTLNNSVFYWKQEGLVFDTIIIGSSMALNNFDPSYFHSKSIGVFGSWGLKPHTAIKVFSEVAPTENKHFLIPLSLPEAAKNENISNQQVPKFTWRLTKPHEWAHLETLRMDTLTYTNIRLDHNGNIPLFSVSEGFQISPERWDFIYAPDTNNLNIIINQCNTRNYDVKFLLLPWRDSCSYPLVTEWMSRQARTKDNFIDLRETQIDQSSWLDGTHLDRFGARVLFSELRKKLDEAKTVTSTDN